MKKILLSTILLLCLFFFFANASFADDDLNPIDPTTIAGVLEVIMDGLKSVAGALAIIFIIVGGVMYMLSGGSKEMMERGKKTIIYAMAGLAIVIAAPTFYSEIASILGGSSVSTSEGTTLQEIALNVLKLLLSIAGTLAIIGMVVGAIWMFTSAGEKDRLELGKKTVIYSIIGTVIVVGALLIAQQVGTLIGG